MDEQTKELYKIRARIMKALSHPSRLLIVDELSKGDRCVCELTGMIGADQSTVSKHLSVLRNSGIIGYEKRRNSVYYTLKIKCVTQYMKCLDDVILGDLEEKQVLLD